MPTPVPSPPIRHSPPVTRHPSLLLRLLWILLLLIAALFLQNLAVFLLGVNFVAVAMTGCVLWISHGQLVTLLLLIAVCIASGAKFREIAGFSPFRRRPSWLLVALNLTLLFFVAYLILNYPGSNLRMGLDLSRSNLLRVPEVRSCTPLPLGNGGFGLFIAERAKGYERLYGLLPVFLMALFWSLTQEMLFRGMMWHALESAGFETGLVNILQALLYAVPFHRANLLGAAVLVGLGLWLGWFRRRDGNIATAVLFHAVALCLISSPNEIGSWFM